MSTTWAASLKQCCGGLAFASVHKVCSPLHYIEYGVDGDFLITLVNPIFYLLKRDHRDWGLGMLRVWGFGRLRVWILGCLGLRLQGYECVPITRTGEFWAVFIRVPPPVYGKHRMFISLRTGLFHQSAKSRRPLLLVFQALNYMLLAHRGGSTESQKGFTRFLR